MRSQKVVYCWFLKKAVETKVETEVSVRVVYFHFWDVKLGKALSLKLCSHFVQNNQSTMCCLSPLEFHASSESVLTSIWSRRPCFARTRAGRPLALSSQSRRVPRARNFTSPLLSKVSYCVSYSTFNASTFIMLKIEVVRSHDLIHV